MRKKVLIGIVLLAIVLLGAAVYAARSKTETPTTTNGAAETTEMTQTTDGKTLAPAPSASQTTDVAYGSDPAQILDIHAPDGSGPFPAIMMIHGGGWAQGDKRVFANTATSFSASLPAVVFNIEYRLGPAGQYPNAADDVELALTWIRQNAALYHVDPSRVGILAGSAGGNLGGMLLDNGISVFVGWSGIYDFPLTTTDPLKGSNKSNEKSQIVNYAGCSYKDCPDTWAAASPVNHVSSSVAMMLVHSTQEFVPLSQMYALADAQKKAGGEVETYEVPGNFHSNAVKNQKLPDGRVAESAALDFFRQNL